MTDINKEPESKKIERLINVKRTYESDAKNLRINIVITSLTECARTLGVYQEQCSTTGDTYEVLYWRMKTAVYEEELKDRITRCSESLA